MKMAMGMAMDMGLAGEDEGEDLSTMSDELMVRRQPTPSAWKLTVSSSNPSLSTAIWPTFP